MFYRRGGIYTEGSHKLVAVFSKIYTHGKFKPVVWTAEKSETVLLCGCKRSDGKPFCDSTHESL